MVASDFILNGTPHGDFATEFAETNYDSGLWRPYRDRNGNKCVTINVGRQYSAKLGRDVMQHEKMTFREALSRGYEAPTLYLTNATLLRKDDWIKLDRMVVKVARVRLRAWSDLAASNTFTLDGMTKQVLEHETMSDPGEAKLSMTSVTESRRDTPEFQLEGVPLPFTQVPFWYDERELRISRASGASLSMLSAEASARRVAETIEKLTIGIAGTLTFGTTGNYSRASTIYGYTTHPSRNTAVMSAPTGSNSGTTVSEVLAMRSTLYGVGHTGPFVIYNGTDWDRYLDDDHFRFVTQGGAAPLSTLRRRLVEIEDIRAVRRLDFLTPANTGGTFDFIMVALGNAEVARAVIGMPLRTIQWPSHGGAQLNFKVMAIMVPQIRSDHDGNSGINHGQTT